MEAATTEPQQAEAQKLKIDKFADGNIECLRFEGAIDEDFEGKKLAQSVKAKTLVLDIGTNPLMGFGDPAERSEQAIREDLLDGYISLETARRDYGYKGT